jgi:ATP-dependent Clp protease ATP-binding subunit ClpB
VIQKSLQDPLANMILEGKIKDGETVKATVKDGKLALNGETVEDAQFSLTPPPKGSEEGGEGDRLVH